MRRIFRSANGTFFLSKRPGADADLRLRSDRDGLLARRWVGQSWGIVGFAVNALKQAMHSVESDRLLLLPYETLCSEPAYAMAAVYEFTGLPSFAHDFENISFDASEFDARLGTPGLHAVHPVAASITRQTILPPDLWRRYEGESIWGDPAFNTRNVRVV